MAPTPVRPARPRVPLASGGAPNEVHRSDPSAPSPAGSTGAHRHQEVSGVRDSSVAADEARVRQPALGPAGQRHTTADWFRHMHRSSSMDSPRRASVVGFAQNPRTDSARLAQHPRDEAAIETRSVRSIASPSVTRSRQLRENAFCQQAAYLLLREFQGRPLSEPHKDLMWRVSQVRAEVLERLPMGRSNVLDDVAIHQGQSGERHATYRALAARRLKWDIPNGSSQAHLYIRAALTAIAGSGSCGDHSILAMHLLGPVLKNGERAVRQKLAGEDDLDHAWVCVEGAMTGATHMLDRHAVILDAWADGPVIDPQDCAFVQGQMVENLEIFDFESCEKAYEAFKSESRVNHDAAISELARQLQRRDHQLKHENPSARDTLARVVRWPPSPVLAAPFLKELSAFTRSAQDDRGRERLEQMALQVARGAPDWSRYQHDPNLAAKILQCATHLGRPENRMPIRMSHTELGLSARGVAGGA